VWKEATGGEPAVGKMWGGGGTNVDADGQGRQVETGESERKKGL